MESYYLSEPSKMVYEEVWRKWQRKWTQQAMVRYNYRGSQIKSAAALSHSNHSAKRFPSFGDFTTAK